MKGGWGKGNVGGVKQKEVISADVQLGSSLGWLSLSTEENFLTEKISRSLSCCRSVFTTHSLKNTSCLVTTGSNFSFLKLLGLLFYFFMPRLE